MHVQCGNHFSSWEQGGRVVSWWGLRQLVSLLLQSFARGVGEYCFLLCLGQRRSHIVPASTRFEAEEHNVIAANISIPILRTSVREIRKEGERGKERRSSGLSFIFCGHIAPAPWSLTRSQVTWDCTSPDSSIPDKLFPVREAPCCLRKANRSIYPCYRTVLPGMLASLFVAFEILGRRKSSFLERSMKTAREI